MRHTLAVFFAVLAVCLPGQARGRAAAGADGACRSAMPAYYAALLASARGDADATLRHLIVFKSRWDEVRRQSDRDRAAWLLDSVSGQRVGDAVASRIESARRRLPRDVVGAHADLESVRVMLRDARVRHGLRTIDDAITEYHDAMERLTSHVGASNEIALMADDFVAIRVDIRRAVAAWSNVQSSKDFRELAGSNRIAAATTGTLATIGSAATQSDATAAQQAARDLRVRYFDLLAVLARQA